jgi:hypothetical protein
MPVSAWPPTPEVQVPGCRENKTIARSPNGGNGFSFLALKSQSVSLPGRGELPKMGRRKGRPIVMKRLEFEPFGEPLAEEASLRPVGRASRWLLWTGAAAFWSLVILIVVARAAYFEAGVFSGFDRVAALARAVF